MSTGGRSQTEMVEAFYAAENARDLAAWTELWHPDGEQTFWVASGRAPVVGRDALVEETRGKFAIRPPYRIDADVEALEDRRGVLARLAITMADGSPAPADIWCVFRFASDGRIARIEEIVGTAE